MINVDAVDIVKLYRGAISELFNNTLNKYLPNNFDSSERVKNPIYWRDEIERLSKDIDSNLINNNELKSIAELDRFNSIIISLVEDLVDFISRVKDYKNNFTQFNDDEGLLYSFNNVLNSYKRVDSISDVIERFVYENKEREALIVKNYCISLFQRMVCFVENNLFININNCPFSNKNNEVIKELKGFVLSPHVRESIMKEDNKRIENNMQQPHKEQKTIIDGITITGDILALKSVYEGKKNSDLPNVIKATHLKSVEKIEKLFNKWSNKLNRQSDPDKRKIQYDNKIKLFENVKKLLSNKYYKSIDEDLSMLNSYKEKYY